MLIFRLNYSNYQLSFATEPQRSQRTNNQQLTTNSVISVSLWQIAFLRLLKHPYNQRRHQCLEARFDLAGDLGHLLM